MWQRGVNPSPGGGSAFCGLAPLSYRQFSKDSSRGTRRKSPLIPHLFMRETQNTSAPALFKGGGGGETQLKPEDNDFSGNQNIVHSNSACFIKNYHSRKHSWANTEVQKQMLRVSQGLQYGEPILRAGKTIHWTHSATLTA